MNGPDGGRNRPVAEGPLEGRPRPDGPPVVGLNNCTQVLEENQFNQMGCGGKEASPHLKTL